MRKPSPISTSSPRASTSSRPRPSAVATSASAAAQLFTTIAASAAGTAASSAPIAASPRGPRRPVPQVELDVGGAAGRDDASTAAADSGARPRLVCTRTPVALSTGLQAARRGGQGGQDGVDRVRRRDLAVPDPLLHPLDGAP